MRNERLLLRCGSSPCPAGAGRGCPCTFFACVVRDACSAKSEDIVACATHRGNLGSGKGRLAADGQAACASLPRAVKQGHHDIWRLSRPFSILESVTDSIIWMVVPRPLRLKENPIFLRSL